MAQPEAPILCSAPGCENPAVCLGTVGGYEDQPPDAMCDEHCGHGQEDGRCVPIGEAG